jgi:hypothetical protein
MSSDAPVERTRGLDFQRVLARLGFVRSKKWDITCLESVAGMLRSV